MSVHGMKPQFVDREGYIAWKKEWRGLYKHLSSEIIALKHRIKDYQRQGLPQGGVVKERQIQRVMAKKLMSAFEDAKIRWNGIEAARKSVEEQAKEYPILVEDCRNIDFHFNKKSLELPFVPMWVVKAKGKTFYVNHVDCQTPWTTRETPDHPSTKGSIRIKRGSLHINEDGDAMIS
jgi:hypothetical protein